MNVFVIMPFRPELRYMYLFLKQHIEAAFPGVRCERGDDTVLTVTILDKILLSIQGADVVIADCTGRNPNVFYELGFAHSQNKPVVLITSDPVEIAPTDIRGFEFIPYSNPESFIANLDKALRRLLGTQFSDFYARVSELFDELRKDRKLQLKKVDEDIFATLAAKVIADSGTPALDDTKAVATLFLPAIVEGPARLDVMIQINEWIETKFG
jgi:hypothetical protein